MAKHKLPPGTWIEREMFESKAFLSLKGFAPQLLLLFLGKRDRQLVLGKDGKEQHRFVNLDNLTMPYMTLEKTYHISRPRIVRGIDELLAKGFLKVRHPGGAYKQDKTIYALIDKWLIWHPGVVFSERKKDVHKGYQGRRK